MKNYAGHRLSPWLGHLMISRTETARPLLTLGKIMQFPEDEEIVMASAVPPIRARKARFFEDHRLTQRILPPPIPEPCKPEARPADDWSNLASIPAPPAPIKPKKPKQKVANKLGASQGKSDGDPANSFLRREPGLPRHVDIAPDPAPARSEFDFGDPAEDAANARKPSPSPTLSTTPKPVPPP